MDFPVSIAVVQSLEIFSVIWRNLNRNWHD